MAQSEFEKSESEFDLEEEEEEEEEDEEEEEEDSVHYSREWWLHFLGLDDDAEDAFDPEEIEMLMKDIDQMVDSTYTMTRLILNSIAGTIISKLYSAFFGLFFPGIRLPRLPLPHVAAKRYFISKRIQETLKNNADLDLSQVKGHIKLANYKP